MIVHFLEVWALLTVAFAIGCLIGALAYELLAQSPAEHTQLAMADALGNVVDRFRERLGIDPTWREYRHVPESAAAPQPRELPANRVHVVAPRARQPSPEPPPDPPTFTPDKDDDDDVMDIAVAETLVAELPDGLQPKRPASLLDPRRGVPDNLQKIRGIGKKNERVLNGLGIFHFGQIAAWTPAEILWIGQRIAFSERIERDDWIGQAVILASGGHGDIEKTAEQSPRDELFWTDDEYVDDDPDLQPYDDEEFDAPDEDEPSP